METVVSINVPKRPSRSSRGYINSPSPPSAQHRFPSINEYLTDTSDEEDMEGRSGSTSSIEEEDCDTVQVIFKKIYMDPLQDLLDSIDADAANILRTGKLTVVGEAGDMDILQPLLFSLQPSEADVPVLLPQLLQNPFFLQKDDSSFGSSSTHADNLLNNGYIRLGVIVDQIIYELLSTHCCKGPGARQADTLIDTALKTTYMLSGLQRFQQACKNPPPLLPKGYTVAESPNKEIAEEDSDESDENEIFLSVNGTHDVAKSRSSGIFSSSSSIRKPSSNTDEDLIKSPDPIVVPLSRPRADSLRMPSRRKDSHFFPPYDPSQRRISELSDVSVGSSVSILQDNNSWSASLPPPKDMIIGAYGDNSYPILIWNPDLKVSFKIGTKPHNMSSTTTVVEDSKELLNLKVVNTMDHKIAFSIRAYRQSMLHRSHVIYPKAGLHILEPKQEWIVEAEMLKGEQNRDEHFCIDLLVCALNCKPAWNIHRRYAVIKQSQDQHKFVKKISRGAPFLPGSCQQKDLGHSLKQVILHGLQSVVKNKLDEAEIIFTHAVHLPLFQRVPLKAFAYICLAVVANKRRKKGENTTKVGHILKLVNSMDKLAEACESAPNMRMPKMIALVKQLKKELNPAKVIKEQRKEPRATVSMRNETTKEVDISGDGIDLYNVSLMVPGGALPQTAKITLSHMNQEEIHQSIQSSSWSSMLSIIGAVCIQCSPPVERFNVPVIITLILPSDITLPDKSTPLRLLQSNYMSSWTDVTDEPVTEVSLSHQQRLTIRTDHSGWLVVAALQLDISKIMPVAIKSVFSEESVILNINTFGFIFPDKTHAQISVFLSPQSNDSGGSGGTCSVTPPPGHRQIAFPHSFKASKGQKIRIELQGKFVADVEAGQTDLSSEFKVDGVVEGIIEKTIKLTSEAKGLYGKLIISTFCTSHKKWEQLQEMNLSSAADAHQQTTTNS